MVSLMQMSTGCKRKSANIRCINTWLTKGQLNANKSSPISGLIAWIAHGRTWAMNQWLVSGVFASEAEVWQSTKVWLRYHEPLHLMFDPYTPQWFLGWNDHPHVVCTIVIFTSLYSARETEHIMNISCSFLRNLGLRMPGWTYRS